jgi:hypothetical protein
MRTIIDCSSEVIIRDLVAIPVMVAMIIGIPMIIIATASRPMCVFGGDAYPPAEPPAKNTTHICIFDLKIITVKNVVIPSLSVYNFEISLICCYIPLPYVFLNS